MEKELIKQNMKLDFIDILQILFIYLKLTGEINWSWWLVLSPIIISYILHRIIKFIDDNID